MQINVQNEALRKVMPLFTKMAADNKVFSPNSPDKTDLGYLVLRGSHAEGLWLTGSNGERTLSMQVEAAVVEEGAAYCQAKVLSALIGKMPKTELTLSADANDDAPVLVVATDSMRYIVKNNDLYFSMKEKLMQPLQDAFEQGPPIMLPDQVVMDMTGEALVLWRTRAERLSPFACTDTYRPFMKSIHWHVDFDGGKQAMAATNGSILGSLDTDTQGLEGVGVHVLNNHPAILPYLKALPKGEPVKVFVVGDGDERRVHFHAKGFCLWSKAGEQYADYRRVFPEVTTTAFFEVDGLKETLDRMMILTKGGYMPRVKMSVNGAIVLADMKEGERLPTEKGCNEETIEAKVEGQPLETTFQIPMLQEVFKGLSGAVSMGFSDKGAAALVRQVDDEEHRFLVMPTRPS